MRPLFISVLVGLVIALLASCAPKATQPPEPLQVASQTSGSITHQPQVTTGAPAVVAAATSRGPNLEATDPASVNLSSGQLQLVEFFRFT
jgi:hypothetical protein